MAAKYYYKVTASITCFQNGAYPIVKQLINKQTEKIIENEVTESITFWPTPFA
jgi:hypothetical protein